MDQRLFIFITLLLICYFWALWESATEGQHGGGEKFIGWRLKIKGAQITSRYHFFLIHVTIPLFLLAIWIASNFSYNIGKMLVGTYPLMIVFEDFLWFLVNPFYGYKNFLPGKAKWITGPWVIIGPIHFPMLYLFGVSLGLLILLL